MTLTTFLYSMSSIMLKNYKPETKVSETDAGLFRMTSYICVIVTQIKNQNK